MTANHRACSVLAAAAGAAAFLMKGSGLGGTFRVDVAAAAAEKRKLGAVATGAAPPKAGATAKRPNPPTSELRRCYERSDLPIVILQGARTKLNWKVEIPRLDFHHFLPIFFGGLREVSGGHMASGGPHCGALVHSAAVAVLRCTSGRCRLLPLATGAPSMSCDDHHP